MEARTLYEVYLVKYINDDIKMQGHSSSERLSEEEKLKEERFQIRNVAFGLTAIFFVSGIICITATPSPKNTSNPIETITAETNEKQSIELRLSRLQELHEKGLITDSEFKEKRQEILKSV